MKLLKLPCQQAYPPQAGVVAVLKLKALCLQATIRALEGSNRQLQGTLEQAQQQHAAESHDLGVSIAEQAAEVGALRQQTQQQQVRVLMLAAHPVKRPADQSLHSL